MAISKQGVFEAPRKSPFNLEIYKNKCDLERRMMEKLEADPEVAKWQKQHDISITWIDENGRQHHYLPDFLVEYADGRLAIIEVKGPDKMDSPSVLRKRSAAEEWCRRRGMEYELTTRV